MACVYSGIVQLLRINYIIHTTSVVCSVPCLTYDRCTWIARQVFMPLMFSAVHSSSSFICYWSCERDILQTNKLILLQIGPWGKAWSGQLWGLGSQRSGSLEAEIIFGGVAEVSFSASWSSRFSSCTGSYPSCHPTNSITALNGLVVQAHILPVTVPIASQHWTDLEGTLSL